MKREKRHRTTEAKPVVLDQVFRFDTFLVFYQGSAPGDIGLTATLSENSTNGKWRFFPLLPRAIDRKEACGSYDIIIFFEPHRDIGNHIGLHIEEQAYVNPYVSMILCGFIVVIHSEP